MTTAPADMKIFTVEKANRALPLVRRIVADILEEHPRWKELVARYEVAVAAARPETGEPAKAQELRRAVNESAERISGFVAELEQIGVVAKGLEQGLVDFFGMHDGRLVHLCWQHGETEVAHWHELDTGFAGRQPITPGFAASESE